MEKVPQFIQIIVDGVYGSAYINHIKENGVTELSETVTTAEAKTPDDFEKFLLGTIKQIERELTGPIQLTGVTVISKVLERYKIFLSSRNPLPTTCDGKEQLAFEAWAKDNNYNMEEHPLHYLFLDTRTYSARQGWYAAIAYVNEQMKENNLL